MDKELKELMQEINKELNEIKVLLKEQKEKNRPIKLYIENEYTVAKSALKYGVSRR